MVNTSMLRARRGESTDEWYTTWPVVDRELSRHMDGLRGARVYCNCDGPESMFARWFAMHYTQLGLAGLRLSRFNPASHTLFAPDASGDTWEWDGAGWVHARLHGDGSFDSVECVRFAAQADVVCTNPPFSLLGQYLPLMVGHARHVLVLGNMNAVKYHGVFPLMMGGRLRLGYDTGRMGFMVHGERPAVLSTARWFTTLPVERAPFHPSGHGGRVAGVRCASGCGVCGSVGVAAGPGGFVWGAGHGVRPVAGPVLAGAGVVHVGDAFVWHGGAHGGWPGTVRPRIGRTPPRLDG